MLTLLSSSVQTMLAFAKLRGSKYLYFLQRFGVIYYDKQEARKKRDQNKMADPCQNLMRDAAFDDSQ